MCRISDQLIQRVTLLNLLPRCHALVRTEINFLSRSFDRLTIEESFSKMGPTKPRNRESLERVLKEKENKYENQIEVL